MIRHDDDISAYMSKEENARTVNSNNQTTIV